MMPCASVPYMSRKTRLTGTFINAAKALEDAFFLEQDKILLEKQREMKKMAETKESLAAVSGITNDAVLTRLVELNIKPETVAALSTVPLVEVAWADGKVDEDERRVILEHADTMGIAPGTIERELFERWLSHRPEPTLLEAWKSYISGLCERLGPEEVQSLKEELLRSTTATAKASGGFLGMGKISKQEQEVLAQLVSCFPLAD